jgi:hypothetical protein
LETRKRLDWAGVRARRTSVICTHVEPTAGLPPLQIHWLSTYQRKSGFSKRVPDLLEPGTSRWSPALWSEVAAVDHKRRYGAECRVFPTLHCLTACSIPCRLCRSISLTRNPTSSRRSVPSGLLYIKQDAFPVKSLSGPSTEYSTMSSPVLQQIFMFFISCQVPADLPPSSCPVQFGRANANTNSFDHLYCP